MQLNEADPKARLIISVLILTVGIGTLLQFLEGHKIDDEPAKIPYVTTYTMTNSSYIGTASTTTTII